MRVFDNLPQKPEPVQRALETAPKIGESLCEECQTHFDAVRRYLDACGVSYRLTPTLVRGLDYYTRTTFEFMAEALGAALSLAGGGRYDYLIEEVGGPATPAVGIAPRSPTCVARGARPTPTTRDAPSRGSSRRPAASAPRRP